MIRYHSMIKIVSNPKNKFPIEAILLIDIDHFWAFTFENFWQDTIRKSIKPAKYLENLKKDVESYFITKAGLKMASQLLSKREREVNKLKESGL